MLDAHASNVRMDLIFKGLRCHIHPEGAKADTQEQKMQIRPIQPAAALEIQAKVSAHVPGYDYFSLATTLWRKPAPKAANSAVPGPKAAALGVLDEMYAYFTPA